MEAEMEIEVQDNTNNLPTEVKTRYSNWKKNTKLLYSYLNTNTNKWPSLTCQFFPDVDEGTDTHRLLLSMFTSPYFKEQECVYISKISALSHLSLSSLNNFDIDEMEFKPDTHLKLPKKNLQLDLFIEFPRDGGDCNKARYMPQNPDLIACGSSNGSIYLFDRTKRFSTKLTTANFKQYECKLIEKGQELAECLSLSWNIQKEALLASSLSNGTINLWDIQKFDAQNKEMNDPFWSLKNFDNDGCNDISWMSNHDSIFAVGTENNKLGVFDIRENKKDPIRSIQENIHQGGINSCKFNYMNSMLLGSGDSEGNINLWDLRSFDKEPISTLKHGNSISAIEWNPHLPEILMSADQADGLVKIWDCSIGKELFVHGGHMLGVNDVAWDWHDPWLVCSVANDNSIHIWKPAKHLVEPSP